MSVGAGFRATHRQADQRADPGEGVAEQEQQRRRRRAPSAMPSWMRQPTSSATRPAPPGSARLHEVGEGAAGEHRAAGHRQRAEPVDQALVHVVGDARAGAGGGEGDGLREDARPSGTCGSRTALVVPPIVDGPAEDVAEQHHEHDRLDQPEDDDLGDPGHPDQVALGDHQRVADGLQQAAARPAAPRRCGGVGHGTHFDGLLPTCGLPSARRRPPCPVLALAVRRRSLGGVAGERDEDVVEGGAAQADVVDLDRRGRPARG